MNEPIALNDWILIREMTEEQVLASGLVIPASTNREGVLWGEVLSVSADLGPQVKDLLSGKLVSWPKFCGVDHDTTKKTLFVRYGELTAFRMASGT